MSEATDPSVHGQMHRPRIHCIVKHQQPYREMLKQIKEKADGETPQRTHKTPRAEEMGCLHTVPQSACMTHHPSRAA